MLYTTGDRVTHAQYGDGSIVRTNEYHTVIDFDSHGERTFASPRVVLTQAFTPAPVKAVPRRRSRTKKAGN